ncbi:MAG: hypothetical protein D3911_01500 [Candidatus Electrothrix sp. AW3_4]|nr:hypothetical protein [Candidatus Electrothrix gigas]
MLPANTGWFDWILLDVMQGNKGESSCSSLLPVAFHVFLHYDQQIKMRIGLKFVEKVIKENTFLYLLIHSFCLVIYSDYKKIVAIYFQREKIHKKV